MDLSLSGQSRDAEGWRPAGSLGQEEALFRIEQRNTALASLPDRALVIAVGIVSGKGKMKAVLTVRSSMATSCVATQARQDGNDVAGKVPRTILPRLHVDQSRNLLTFEHGPDRDLAGGERTEIAARLDRPNPGGSTRQAASPVRSLTVPSADCRRSSSCTPGSSAVIVAASGLIVSTGAREGAVGAWRSASGSQPPRLRGWQERDWPARRAWPRASPPAWNWSRIRPP